MSKARKCCCKCPPPPDILIEGMTAAGPWVASVSHPCCWTRTYNYNDAQPWVLIYDEIVKHERVEYTSVVDYLEFRREPPPLYRVTVSSGGIVEDCPTLPTYPFIDCGTWVKAATRTVHEIYFGKTRNRFWTKQKDITVVYSHSDIACDEHPDTRKYIVQVKQNFWWSSASQQNHPNLGLNTGYDSSFTLEPCFDWRVGGAPAGWVNSTYPPTEDTPWQPPIESPDDWIKTLDFVVKTKVYDELPPTDVWSFDDSHTLECWSFCGNFDQMIRPIACIQEEEPLEECSCEVIEDQHNIAPTGPPINPVYACLYCPDSSGVGATQTILPAVVPSCSTNSYLIDILRFVGCASLGVMTAKVATHTPMLPKPHRFKYTCGPDCVGLTCASTIFGWHIFNNGAEKCAHDEFNGQTLETQVSFDLDLICESYKAAVCHQFITITLDFNL